MRINRIGMLLGVTVLALLAPMTTALADTPGPWTPYHSQGFEAPAGTRCPFGLRGEVLRDHELIRTLSTQPDGSPDVQEIVGPLVFRFTNTATGRSVVRNLTGTGLIDHGTDGSFTLYLVGGHFGAGLAPGGPAFLYFTGSGHALVVAADGSRTPIFGHGPVENLCTTLAG
jgi:hypothetical protein